ncbi:RagB/SusD family nutrient uptake outer membrane protein [Dyadobacter fermentans]|uniref:RagB/SusD domain protein n=1 Tax=Dyadobacter fermentans (strain ATCC 700827 / DSM 18053 / CIP 107007 / KCTC 52180 / NS114) TaxID=471854 RepID=C6W115_DYAFD|nr:RagB/SusD family nutrient uptake outer membrane protein [Dyadobacter fermentans]ACT95470.1 RagB/SusD domain protein [Dyadobacter fermentans DSM 18053]
MKKHILYTCLILGMSACNDFLTENPTGQLTTGSSVSSPEIARAFVDGSYSQITTFNNGGGGWGGNNASLVEFMTGKADGNSQTEAFKFFNLEYDARAFYVDGWWSGMYSGIARANLAIQKIGEISTLPAATKTNMIAEARAMRALYYFQLVRMFGDVPKITTLITSLDDVQTPRSPVKEIYDEIIIPDLLEAEKSTLPWRDTAGRMSMGAIKALLAHVYLTYAGFPVSAGVPAYTESAKRSKEIIDNGTYSLFAEYTDMIVPANRNQTEFIFQVQHEKDIRNNGLTPVTLPAFTGIASYSDEYGGLLPRKEFVESFEKGDKRAKEKQFFYTYYKGHPSDYPAGDPRRDSLNLGGYYIYKWFDKQAIDNDAKANINYTIYRYAEILLMYAEASNRVEGKPNAQAQKALNDVRKRAQLPAVTTTNVDEFEKAVWAERYFELCYEGKMWFDMIRTRKVRNDLTKQWDNFVGHKTVYGKTFAEKNLLLPIPQRETDNNKSLEQNVGF